MSGDDALGPLQRWPDNVNPTLWRSRRALMGDPDLGMPQASTQLQMTYEQGLDFMRANDPAAAGQAFAEAAEEGHPGAMREIAVAAFVDLPREIAWALVPLFDRAADGGDGRAMAYLGLFCRMKENAQGALEHYRASDERGDPEGSRELGILLAGMGQTDEALTAVERSRSRGSASGTLAQGILLEQSFGDRDGALEAFSAAAEMGHPKGSIHLIDLLISEGNQGAAEQERSRALENLTEHRALMEFLEGESAVQHTMAQVKSGSALAGSGSSCALPAVTVLVAALVLSHLLIG